MAANIARSWLDAVGGAYVAKTTDIALGDLVAEAQ